MEKTLLWSMTAMGLIGIAVWVYAYAAVWRQSRDVRAPRLSDLSLKLQVRIQDVYEFRAGYIYAQMELEEGAKIAHLRQQAATARQFGTETDFELGIETALEDYERALQTRLA